MRRPGGDELPAPPQDTGREGSRVEFRVLGSLEVRRGGAALPLAGPGQRTLLAALLARGGQVVPLDLLAADLWGPRAPADPRNALQTAVARLRESLGDGLPLRTRPPGYLLDVGPDELDAARFEQLVARAREVPPDAAGALLDEALAFWRGPAYAGFDDGAIRAEAVRLEELRLQAVERQADLRLARGDHEAAVTELRRVVADHPLRDPLVARLMRALAAAGRSVDALAVFRDHRERLVEETGLDPSPALLELHTTILQGPPSSPSVSDPAPRAAPGAGWSGGGDEQRSVVPVAPTTLVGRQDELVALTAALAVAPVVTVVGTGGVGKTRLAAEVAAGEVAAQVREVGWVELASVTDPAAVDFVVAGRLGVHLDGSAPSRQALVDALQRRRVLLVLDNAEHLLDALAPLVDDLRRRCPGVQVLATSRERLAVEGERTLPLPPLPVGGVDSDAVRLFLSRAADAGVHDLDAALPEVIAICRELEGLPLAVELAAARCGALPPAELLAALRDDLPHAAGRRRGGAERQRDLWSVVDWSHRLLDDRERWLFDRLGVFAGAFDVDLAHEICAGDADPPAATVALLASLAERSLVVRVPVSGARGRGRFRLLRPLRAFARQRLADAGQLAPLADRHLAVVVAHAERAAGPPLSAEGWAWFEDTLDDLREARRHARLTGDVRSIGRLVAAGYRFEYWRPGSELLGWADDALALPGADLAPEAPSLFTAAAAAAWMRGDLVSGGIFAARAVDACDGPDDPAYLHAMEVTGDVAAFEGRLEDAEDAFGAEARAATEQGDPDATSMGWSGVAITRAYQGRSDEAGEAAELAVHAAQDAGPASLAFAVYATGECLADTDPTRAIERTERAVELARACDAWFVEGVARLTVTSLRARHGDAAAALPAFDELLRHWERSGSWTQQWTTLRNLAELLVRLGVDETAVVLASAAEQRATANQLFGTESERLSEALAVAARRLGEDAYEAARRRGRELEPAQVLELAHATVAAVRG